MKKIILMIIAIIFVISISQVYSFSQVTTESLTALQYSSQAWGDYNNDGDYDLATCGSPGGTTTYRTIIYKLNNSASQKFTELDFGIINVTECSLNFGDLNKDGFDDLIVAGRYGSTDNTNNFTLSVYLNNNGTNFTNSQNLTRIKFGYTVIGDINNDEYLDLVVIGCSNGTGSQSNCNQKNASVYTNKDGTLEYNSTWSQNLTGVWKGSLALGDYDNDGRLDLAVLGTTGSSHSDGAITKVYKNNGSTFIEDSNNNLPGIFWGALAFNDYDNDGDLDLIITGRNTSGSRTTIVYKNDWSQIVNNTKPSAPATVNATYSNNQLVIKWSNGSDNETPTLGLYYNLRAGSNRTNNNIVSSKNAVSSNPTQGYFGNMMQAHNKTLNIPQRCVFYSVQTVDTGLLKSDFSTVGNYSSNETCDSYDNDCDLSADEGFDINNDGIIQATNETFDKDGDGYYPHNTTLIDSNSNTNTTYQCTNYATYDCDDSDSTKYPGASCSRSGYTGSTYDSDCVCSGGSSTSSGSSGGGTAAQIQKEIAQPTDTTKTPVDDSKNDNNKEPIAAAVSATSDSGSSVEENIISSRYKITRDVVIIGDTTQITERVKALDLDGLEGANLDLKMPKRVVSSAANIKEIDPFKVIQEDPEIEFGLGDLQPLQEKSVQYVIPERLGRDDINEIIANLTFNDLSAEQRKIALEEQINETAKYINLTQEVFVDYEKNQTEFKIKIDYQKNETILGDVYIYTEIPKCLIEIIKEELIESDQDYEIVSEDPLIVWHFKNLLDVKEINYNIKAVADEDCANKAKALAIAKQIVQVKFSPKKSNVFWALAIFPIVMMAMILFGFFAESMEHKEPRINSLIRYVKHHFRHGFHEHHIKSKLAKEGYTKDEIKEALYMNSKNRLHYFFQRMEIGLEEIILMSFIVLDILDYAQILPIDGVYIQKIMAWSALAFLLYKVSITRLILGIRKRVADILLIMGFFLLILKTWVGFAQVAFIEAQNAGAFVTDLYGFIIHNNTIFDVQCFIAGILIIAIVALYLAINEEVKAPCFLSIVHFHPEKSKNIFKIILRFFITLVTFLGFFVIIFNLIIEWLAIALDSFVLVLVAIFVIFMVIKHHKKFISKKTITTIEESSESFYEKVIHLFYYKKTILLGISGLLILHILTELGNFIMPYATGVIDILYFGNLYENHMPLFSVIPSVKSLFVLQAAGLSIMLKVMIFLGFLLNILGALYLVLLPAYLWYHMFKNRRLSLENIPKLKLNIVHIFLAVLSICFLFLNPALQIGAVKKTGLVGVDIQTKFLDLGNLNFDLLLALAIGVLAVIASLKAINAVKKLVLTGSLIFFVFYIYLFFENTTKYYVESIRTLLLSQPLITLVLVLFLAINIVFYSLGVISFFIEMYIRREIWFEWHRIKFIENYYLKHHKFHFIHHPNAHKENVHGDKEEYLERYIKKHILEGEQIMAVQEHLKQQGWSYDIINKASYNVLGLKQNK